MKYIEKLNALRVSKDLSFRQLGFMCELSESAVKKILYKKCAPLVPSIEKLCAALGTSLPELFCDAGEFVFKKSDDTVALFIACDSLPAEEKSHLLAFLKIHKK
jgi:transcriptional regulator with XRE-family HTH domain